MVKQQPNMQVARCLFPCVQAAAILGLESARQAFEERISAPQPLGNVRTLQQLS
jgi:hypothetical protein